MYRVVSLLHIVENQRLQLLLVNITLLKKCWQKLALMPLICGDRGSKMGALWGP